MGKPDPRVKKIQREKLAKTENKCSRCPPHDKENRRRRPRPDKYKDKRGHRVGEARDGDQDPTL